jgi:small subunit ribosomal protein S13
MAEEKQTAEKKDNFRYIVRVANTDLDGNKQIIFALRKVKGVSYSIANAACRLAGVDISKKAGYLNDSEIEKLSGAVENPAKLGAPSWIFNRRKDPETGDDMHILGGDLQFARENDVKIMKKIKSYKGMRHASGLPVRGQRTKSNFRKSKSRGKGTLGVQKKKVKTSGK